MFGRGPFDQRQALFQFQLGDLPVFVHGTFLLIVLLLGAGRATEPVALTIWLVVVFVSVLVHEVGHAMAFNTFGHGALIELYGMGGLTHSTGGRALSAGQSFVVSVAGPIAGFLVGGAVLWAQVWLPVEAIPAWIDLTLRDLVWVNIGWGVLNLLPILPLDGGQALRSLVRMVNPEQAEPVARATSLVFCLAGLVLALYAQMVWAAILCGLFLWQNAQHLRR